MDKATPRPWKMKESAYEDCYYDIEVNGQMIAQINKAFHCDTGDRKANAELIVRAVNSHEALLQACQEACKTLNSFQGNTYQHDLVQRAESVLRKAINQAKG